MSLVKMVNWFVAVPETLNDENSKRKSQMFLVEHEEIRTKWELRVDFDGTTK